MHIYLTVTTFYETVVFNKGLHFHSAQCQKTKQILRVAVKDVSRKLSQVCFTSNLITGRIKYIGRAKLVICAETDKSEFAGVANISEIHNASNRLVVCMLQRTIYLYE